MIGDRDTDNSSDPLDNRVFPWQIIDTTNNSATSCLTKCAEFGYMAAGMEYGQECCKSYPIHT